MKKIQFAALSVILMIAMMISTIPHAGANNGMNGDLLIGDVDGDNELTIMDATTVQRSLVNLSQLSELDTFLGDVDGDNALTILDATAIQRRLADLDDVFWSKTVSHAVPAISALEYFAYYPTLCNNQGSVFAGAEIRILFSANNIRSNNKTIRNRYDVYIDDEKIIEGTKTTYLDYTFEHEGTYLIKVVPINLFGEGVSRTIQITVLESPDSPYIADAKYDEDTHIMSVRAAGGAGGYRYRYYIRYQVPQGPGTSEPPDNPIYDSEVTEPSFSYEVQPDGTFRMVSDYIEADTIRIPEKMLNEGLEYLFYISVIDRNGAESPLSLVSDRLF